jgi:PAS domain S-box-containing protein
VKCFRLSKATRKQRRESASAAKRAAFSPCFKPYGNSQKNSFRLRPRIGERPVAQSTMRSVDNLVTTEMLRQSEERFQILIDSIQDYAIYILDPNGFVVSWNSGAERIKGYSAQEVIGKHFSRFYLPDDIRTGKPQRNLEAAAAKGRYEDENLRVRKDGSIFWANVLITAICDASGKVSGFAKVVRDITERKESEQRLRDAERLAALGTTAAVFAHEIANPLNGLSTSLQIATSLMDESAYDNPLLKETMQAAGQEISRLSSLLQDYRSLARPQTIKLQLGDLRQIVEELLAPNIKHYHHARVDVKTEFPENLPLVAVDAEKIKQVLLNLCKNAVEAMPEGGLLTVRAYATDDNVVLEFTDTGQGIPEGFNPFQLFKSTKPQGTGLGLPIVEQIISDHHGTVDYVSELGKGATFRISLPRSTPTIPQRP